MADLALQTSLRIVLLRDQEYKSAVWVGWPEKGQVLLPELDLSTLSRIYHPNQGMTMDGWYGIKRPFIVSRLISGVFLSKNARICWLTYRCGVGKV